MTPGGRVSHPIHGVGRIMSLLAGARVRVVFDERPRLPRIVERAALARTEAASAAMATGVAVPIRRAFDPTTEADAWQAIEALRLGVVPLSRVETYTVGREAELAALHGLLGDGGGLRLLFGDYGHGKTHLIELFEHQARQAGFATARATLDPAEVPPSHPRRLYRALMSGFRCPDAADCSPLPLFERLAESDAHLDPKGRRYSRFLTPALRAHRERTNSDLPGKLLDYVQGEPVDIEDLNQRAGYMDWTHERMLALSDFRTYGRLYAHLIGTWATWCRDAGYKGLVVLFDEVERVSALDAAQRRLADQVLRHYTAVTLPTAHLAFDPNDQDAMYRGGQRVHRNLPLRFTEDQPLSVVMALTPAPDVEATIRRLVSVDSVRIDLSPIARRHHGSLVERVVDLYRGAYPRFAPDGESARRISERVLAALVDAEAVPRHFVRTAVCILDGLRHGGALPG